MAVEFKDRRIERENTYTMLQNKDGTVTLIPVTGQVYEQGTALNSQNLNANFKEINAQMALTATKTELQQISLSYKESYDTLALLKITYPSGDIYNHTVKEDGMIYTYKNGWVSTGIQANGTGIANGTVTPEKTSFIAYAAGTNKNDPSTEKTGCYNADKTFNTATYYRHNKIKVTEGDIVRAVTDSDINYKLFVLLDNNDNIIGLTSSGGEYISTRTSITIDGTLYHCYRFTIPSGVSSIYYQYSLPLKNIADILVINEDIPSTYKPYIVTYSLSKNVNVPKTELAKTAETALIAEAMDSVLKGKNLGFLGDSFTDVSYYYGKKIADRTGCIAHNYGKQGSRVMTDNTVSGNTVKSFLYRLTEMDSNLDVVCIFGGINDASGTRFFTTDYGTINDSTLTYEQIVNGELPLTWYSAFKTLLEITMYKYPQKKILVIIPPHVLNESYAPSITAYRGIEKIREAELKCAEYYGIKVCDLYKECQELNNYSGNVATYRIGNSNDIHPNDLGQQAMSLLIQKSLESLFV